jgi:hypothetical protein
LLLVPPLAVEPPVPVVEVPPVVVTPPLPAAPPVATVWVPPFPLPEAPPEEPPEDTALPPAPAEELDPREQPAVHADQARNALTARIVAAFEVWAIVLRKIGPLQWETGRAPARDSMSLRWRCLDRKADSRRYPTRACAERVALGDAGRGLDR